MLAIIAAIIAFIVGVMLGLIIRRQHPIGDLRVDRSDPYDGPHLFLELDENVSMVMLRKYATFRVKIVDFIPRK